MTTDDKNVLWLLFWLAIMCTAMVAGWSGWAIAQTRAQEQIREERTLAIKDMADAMKVVCGDDPPAPADESALPRAYACIGGLQVMLEAVDIRRKREAADAG